MFLCSARTLLHHRVLVTYEWHYAVSIVGLETMWLFLDRTRTKETHQASSAGRWAQVCWKPSTLNIKEEAAGFQPKQKCKLYLKSKTFYFTFASIPVVIWDFRSLSTYPHSSGYEGKLIRGQVSRLSDWPKCQPRPGLSGKVWSKLEGGHVACQHHSLHGALCIMSHRPP